MTYMDLEGFSEQNQRLKRLVLAVYRVANALNKQKEGVLASELKKQANQVLRSFAETRPRIARRGRRGKPKNNKLFLQIEILQNFFDLAQEFHLINDKNFTVLNKAFADFKNDILEWHKRLGTGRRSVPTKEQRNYNKVGTGQCPVPTRDQASVKTVKELNERQKMLITTIKKKKEISISDVSNMFKGQVSDKTVRRDLIDLMDKGLIGRKGDKRWTKYYLK